MYTDRMDPRSKRIRRDILQAVKNMFSARGFDGLSVAEICQKADVSRSAFYAHFRSPGECIGEVLKEAFAPMESSLLECGLDPDSLLLNKRPLSYYFFAHIEDNLSLYRPLFTDPRGASVLETVRIATEAMSYQLHRPLRKNAGVEWDEERAGLTAAYLSGALLASARNWVLRGCPEDSRVLAYWFSAMAAPGLLELMGISL